MPKQRIYMAWGVVLDLPSSDINQEIILCTGMTCWKHCSKTYRSRSKKWRFVVGSDWDTNVVLNIIHSVCKESAYNAGDCLQCRRPGFNPCAGKILWRRKWQPTLVFLLGKSHGHRSLTGIGHGVAKSWTWLSD